jgi:hypothetical protein
MASGMNVGEPAQLYLIGSRTQRATSLFPTDKPVMQLDAALRTGRQLAEMKLSLYPISS